MVYSASFTSIWLLNKAVFEFTIGFIASCNSIGIFVYMHLTLVHMAAFLMQSFVKLPYD